MVDEIAQGARDAKAVKSKLTAEIPLARLGRPAEIAALCVYLLSDAAAFITGADVPIDGGLTAR
jgi:3alpha(or 20beta)-hydroxysteroid dehydrogenase